MNEVHLHMKGEFKRHTARLITNLTAIQALGIHTNCVGMGPDLRCAGRVARRCWSGSLTMPESLSRSRVTVCSLLSQSASYKPLVVHMLVLTCAT